MTSGTAGTATSGAGTPSEFTKPHGRNPWFSYNVFTAILGAIAGYVGGWWIGVYIAGDYPFVQNQEFNNVSICLALALGVTGWMAGIGAFNYGWHKILGKQPVEHTPVPGWIRYFKMTTDHKVVGRQYLVAVLGFFFTGGLFAMAIRTELLTPYTHFVGPEIYLEIVSEHGTIMMMMASSLVVGPLGNYLVPLMVGSRRMAYPRLEAASLWLFVAGYMCILIALVYGGFNTGWTGYAPLQTQDRGGMDAYLVAFGVIGLGMILNGFNQIVTIVDFRGPGLRWSRLPIFCWAMLATSFLLTLATPVLFVAAYFGVLDRTALTGFYVPVRGGSNFLWENLFWFFGHPEVYIMAVPWFGMVGEMLPVFCRKPLFAYKLGAAGMLGVSLLSFFVWQHHLFMSGMNPDMRPVFMFTTELISVPTGFIFLVGMGTLWRAKMRLTVPMLFCLATFFDFLIGGSAGIFQSDVPIDTTVHGSFFVMAHFHYMIMGGLVFAFFGAVYYWMPRMFGVMLDQKLAKIHFWWMFIAFNTTFFPLYIVGFWDMPRRVFEYAARLTILNDVSSASAYALGASFLVFIYNFVKVLWIDPAPAPVNPWESRGIEWQLPYGLPWYNFDRLPVFLSDPYRYGEPDALPVAELRGPVLERTRGEVSIAPTGRILHDGLAGPFTGDGGPDGGDGRQSSDG